METLTEWQVREIVRNYSNATITEPIPEDLYANALQTLPDKEDIKPGTLEELPCVMAQNIVMTKNELCYFQENAFLCITKNIVTGSTGGYGGAAIRVTKGMSIHSGATNRKTIREDVVENIFGSLCITNKRVVFISQQQGFSKQLIKLTGIIPYSDGISLQFDSNTFTILTRQPVLIAEILSVALANIEL